MKKSKILIISSLLLCSSFLLTSCKHKDKNVIEVSHETFEEIKEEQKNLKKEVKTEDLLIQLTPFSSERQDKMINELRQSIPRQEYEDLKEEDFTFNAEKQESSYNYKDLFVINSYVKDDKMTAEIEVKNDSVTLKEIKEDATVTEDIKSGSFKDDKTVEENVFRGFTSKILSLITYTEIDLPIDVSYIQVDRENLLSYRLDKDSGLFKDDNYEEDPKGSFVRVFTPLFEEETRSYKVLNKEEKEDYKDLIKTLKSSEFKPYKLNSVEEKEQYAPFLSYSSSKTITDKNGKEEVILSSDTILGVYVFDNLNNIMFKVDLEDSKPYMISERTRLNVVLPKEILDKFYNERYIIYLSIESN